MILDEIIANKHQEIEKLTDQYRGKDLASVVKKVPQQRDFLAPFKKNDFSLIAECKKASPSAGLLQAQYDPAGLAKLYQLNGASAISVLTDNKYFQGEVKHLIDVKGAVDLPILRKDFIVDELQIYESLLAGADALLLIVRLLKKEKLQALLKLTEELGMQALVETHNEQEVETALSVDAKIIGLNNRDLDTLRIDIRQSLFLMKKFPQLKEKIVISESGIKTSQEIQVLKTNGIKGVLVGETLLKSHDVGGKLKELLL